ncbi:probable glutamate carboxypeptidase LAMP1 isoform X2 [Cryptomeria japonica]|uniref:probable glutamate carboxypeptidase LAMP1 isoform X2 n=1 Tax=Cryptomeria japonica TaxID=3369 RepID=UPI0027D9E021|nr:probable glutamate carboxypeptidase LAMP1 isoform X2 [Cryptomeria japonica]
MESWNPSQTLLPPNKLSKPGTMSILKLCCSFALVIIAALTLASNAIQFPKKSSHAAGPDHYHKLFLKAASNDSIAKHLKKLTEEPHVAGTPENFATADYVYSVFQSSGLDTHFADYEVLLTYPLSRSLSLSLPEGNTLHLKLQEEPVEGDSSSFNPKVIPTFHAYSPSGDVSAKIVFANYGREEDYDTLREMGVDPKGAIVIAKYGKIFRGDIVQIAAEAGAVATIVYSDPEKYGGNRTEGYYPYSRWLPPSGVQRGSIYGDIGDPLSPGWPSVADAERLSIDDPQINLPSIPSIPISAEDATIILKSLNGPLAPPDWHGALDLPAYHLGGGPAILNLHYKSNHTIAPIRNVIGLIKGSEEPDRYVLLGNHRDAWTFGAGDPNGGTATLLEIAERLGKLLKEGWRPRRSIVLCNWDAEEYALIGSTEWVEENYNLLFSSAVAYLNVDEAVIGPGFTAQATPQLDDLIRDIAKEVEDSDNPGKTIYDSLVASATDPLNPIERLGGGGSDFAAFVQHTGISTAQFSFGQDFPMYHSLYDDYKWMEKFGDPLFHRHTSMATIWGMTMLKLVDANILPFNYSTYADNLHSYVDVLEKQLKVEMEGNLKLRRSFNDHLVLAERGFIDSDGLPGNPWYKHLVYGPTQTNKYGTTSFPGISDSIARVNKISNDQTDENTWADVQHEIWRVARAIDRVALVLRGEFT